MPPGHLDRLVPIALLAALLKAGSTIWTVAQFRFPDITTGDRLRLYARNLDLTPGILVLIAAVLAAMWSSRIVAFTPRLVARGRYLFLAVVAVSTFIAVGQLVGFVWDLTPDQLPFQSFPTRGPALLEEAAGVLLATGAAFSAIGRLRAL